MKAKNIIHKMRLPGYPDKGSAADFDGISTCLVKSPGQDVDSGREKLDNNSEGFLIENSPIN